MVLSNFCINAASGIADTALNAFDKALYNCGFGDYNHLKISSVLPPFSKENKTITLSKGSLVYSAYSSISSCVSGTTISASIGVGIPKDKENIGIIMECSGVLNKNEIENNVCIMIRSAMQLRNIEVERFIIRTSSLYVTQNTYHVALACISLW